MNAAAAAATRRSAPASSSTTWPWCWARAGCPPPTVSATTVAELPVTDLPGFAAARGRPGTPGGSGRVAVGGRGCWCCWAAPTSTRAAASRPVAHGVRTAAAAGCRTVVLTNAAGGLRAGMAPGDPVLITDHLNLTATSPLRRRATSST